MTDMKAYEDSLFAKNEYIIGVAISIPNMVFWLACPHRHSDIFRTAPVDLNHPNQVQGFWTSRNRFINRFEAADMARILGADLLEPIRGGELFSENLW